MTRYIIAFLVFFIPPMLHAEAKILNFYAWSNYLPASVAAEFEKETGIHINYTTYDSNETMYAKLKTDPFSGYDLVVPSSYFIDRMQRQGMLQKIDQTKIQNLSNINHDLLNKDFDPHNNFSIPYFWGTTALVVNKRYFDPATITRWADLWKPQYKNQLLILNDTRDVFSVALLVLGYSINDTDPEHIKAAYLKLKELIPNIKLFNSEAQPSIYIDEDASLGMGWSGPVFQASKENSNIQFVYPQEGFVIWIDNMAITKNAPHLQNVYKFINFILRPEIAKQMSMELGFATPNLAAIKLMPKDLQNNQIIYPDHETLRRGQLQADAGKAVEIYEKYMALLKSNS